MKKNNIDIQRELLADGAGWRYTAESAISLQDLYSRTPFSPLALKRLATSRVVIFGVGSGGSELALLLAKSGVGRICLTDPALLQVHNCTRHVASLQDVGRPKVEAVAEQMLFHNPHIMVETYAHDLFHPDSPVMPEAVLETATLVIAATDKTAVQLAINDLTWRLGIPTVFGGCYEEARGGEVLFTLPGEGTPCLSCLRGGLSQPQKKGPFDYSAAENLEDYQGEPGLSAAINLITAVEAQISLGLLLRGTNSPLGSLIFPQYNFLLIGSALAADYYRFQRPFHIFFQPLNGPRPDCDVCQVKSDDGLPSLLAGVRQVSIEEEFLPEIEGDYGQKPTAD